MNEPVRPSALRRSARFTDAAGVTAAILAALCCAGTSVIITALGFLGLSFLRRDEVLWPVMLVSLVVALWGFWQGARFHRNVGPLLLGALGAVLLACGVIVVHGPPAITMIYGGAVLLVLATIWNMSARYRTIP